MANVEEVERLMRARDHFNASTAPADRERTMSGLADEVPGLLAENAKLRAEVEAIGLKMLEEISAKTRARAERDTANLQVERLENLLAKAQAWICGEDCGGGSHRPMCLELSSAIEKPEDEAPTISLRGGGMPLSIEKPKSVTMCSSCGMAFQSNGTLLCRECAGVAEKRNDEVQTCKVSWPGTKMDDSDRQYCGRPLPCSFHGTTQNDAPKPTPHVYDH